MDKIDALTRAWDNALWEYTLVFEGLNDDDVWRRPNSNLLSIGELTGHVAYWMSRLAPGNTFDSPLVDSRFSYYDRNDAPIQLELGSEQVLNELKKIHEASKQGVAEVKDFDATVPWRDDMKWYDTLEYQVFHLAYHCGQAYSVRHLMGHETTDN